MPAGSSPYVFDFEASLLLYKPLALSSQAYHDADVDDAAIDARLVGLAYLPPLA